MFKLYFNMTFTTRSTRSYNYTKCKIKFILEFKKYNKNYIIIKYFIFKNY